LKLCIYFCAIKRFIFVFEVSTFRYIFHILCKDADVCVMHLCTCCCAEPFTAKISSCSYHLYISPRSFWNFGNFPRSNEQSSWPGSCL
jgi:hypothetical protein